MSTRRGRYGNPAKRSSKPAVRVPLAAGTRDASWHNQPDVHTPKAWHIATVDGTAACCPGPLFYRRSVMILDDASYEYEPETVWDDLRCRRPGCRVHWDTVLARPR